MVPIMQAVEYLHQHKMSHLDVKPDNVMLKEDPETGETIPVLIDFGLSKHYDKMESLHLQFGCQVSVMVMLQSSNILVFTFHATSRCICIGCNTLLCLGGQRPCDCF